MRIWGKWAVWYTDIPSDVRVILFALVSGISLLELLSWILGR